jgi:hypothetical protein
VTGVVEADLLEERDVDRVGVGVEELRAEVDGDAVALVLDGPRVAVPADRPRASKSSTSCVPARK